MESVVISCNLARLRASILAPSTFFSFTVVHHLPFWCLG